MLVNFADIIFKLDRNTCYAPQNVEEYFVQDEEPDVFISVNNLDIEKERMFNTEENNVKRLRIYAVYRKVCNALPKFNAFVLHSATFDVNGVGVAFAAHSGTGKSTHMNLWQQFLGDDLTVVNGDKPIVRFFENEPEQPYAFGSPYNGKERLGCNMRTPLKHICFIERSHTNFVEKVTKEEVIERIFNQVYMPEESFAMLKTMKLIDRLLSCCTLWIIHCNMDISAAEVAYNTIFGK